MDPSTRLEAARVIERTIQLLQQARDCEDRILGDDDLIGDSKRCLARSRKLLAKPVHNPYGKAHSG